MVKSLAKKYIISKLNKFFDKNKDNVAVICAQVDVWTKRLVKISSLFANVSARCADGKLDDTELDTTVTEIENLIKEF